MQAIEYTETHTNMLSGAEGKDENGDLRPGIGYDSMDYVTMRSPPGVGCADYATPGQSLPSGTLGRYANASLIPVEDASTVHAWSAQNEMYQVWSNTW